MLERPRRNRKSATIRSLIRETSLNPEQLIVPLFIHDSGPEDIPITNMPGIMRISLANLPRHADRLMGKGLGSFILFPVVPAEHKDRYASYSHNPDCFYLRAISALRKSHPDCTIITDVAMDPYSSDGHDGLVEDGRILNDESLPVLARMAVAQAEAGADIVGPSDMMDGRVQFIREALDTAGKSETAIMSYTAKYASALYGPFRDALDSAPKSGDKKTYQMDPANAREALREMRLDESEGADYLMVKPAGFYLDIIHRIRENTDLPVVGYQVSGEFAMIRAAAAAGYLDEPRAIHESLVAIARAGANAVITYFAEEYSDIYRSGG